MHYTISGLPTYILFGFKKLTLINSVRYLLKYRIKYSVENENQPFYPKILKRHTLKLLKGYSDS